MRTLVRYYSNQRIMVLGIVSLLLNMLGLSFIWRGWMLFPVEIFSCLSFLSFPAVSAMKSNNVDVKEQGKIQGALYGIRQLGGGVGPVVFGVILSLPRRRTTPRTKTRSWCGGSPARSRWCVWDWP
jgi:fucose permease